MPNESALIPTPSRTVFSSTARMLVVYLGTVALLLGVILRNSAGFSYSLDDPYIHLALAQHILHGTYGINLGETSSPASSVLWPFLLVPFAESSFRAWSPLVLNVLSGIAACFLLGGFLDRWYLRKWPQTTAISRWLLASLFVFSANLVGLTYLGMEHTLQIVLTIACAWAVMEAYAGKPIPTWALALAALAPSARYEDMAFTLAVVLACWLQGRRRAATLTGLLSLLPPIALGIFFHRHGLSFLPNSVIIKGGIISAKPHLFPHAPLLDHLLTIVAVNVTGYLLDPGRWPILLFAGIVAAQAWRKRANPTQRDALLAGVAGLLLIMGIGPYGYLYRYDVCYRLFAFLLAFALLAEYDWFRPMVAGITALVASGMYLSAAAHTPGFCSQIAHQQKLMQHFSQHFYSENVAVNDLGWVSFDNHDRHYVLDLVGLASIEASRQRVKDAAWLDSITRRHNVGLVMIYPYWFSSVPPSWTPVAELHRSGGGPDTVTFYITPIGDVSKVQGELASFARTLPSGAWLTAPPHPDRAASSPTDQAPAR